MKAGRVREANSQLLRKDFNLKKGGILPPEMDVEFIATDMTHTFLRPW
jgi:hypothetical protein